MAGPRPLRLDSYGGVNYHFSDAEVAQVVEHGTENAGVASSTLALGTLKTRLNHGAILERSPVGRALRFIYERGQSHCTLSSTGVQRHIGIPPAASLH